jgi:hypothetical protein
LVFQSRPEITPTTNFHHLRDSTTGGCDVGMYCGPRHCRPYLDTLRRVFVAVTFGGIAVATYARLDDWPGA